MTKEDAHLLVRAVRVMPMKDAIELVLQAFAEESAVEQKRMSRLQRSENRVEQMKKLQAKVRLLPKLFAALKHIEFVNTMDGYNEHECPWCNCEGHHAIHCERQMLIKRAERLLK